MTWTTDQHGKPVDWTKPPHRQGGILTLILEHEETMTPDEARRRVVEYYRLIWRGTKRARPG